MREPCKLCEYGGRFSCSRRDCPQYSTHWTRWINMFADTRLDDWRVRLFQVLFVIAIPWLILGVAKLVGWGP